MRALGVHAIIDDKMSIASITIRVGYTHGNIALDLT